MGRLFLYLIRHGQYNTHYAPDELGGSLTPLGIIQAQHIAQRLKDLPVAAIHHSTLRRATETAQIIAEALPQAPLKPSDLIWENVPSVPPQYADSFANLDREEIRALSRRGDRAFRHYFKPAQGEDRLELMVCHGNLIRQFMCRTLKVPIKAWANADIHNCGLTEVRIEGDGRMLLVSHNDTGHLPLEIKTLM
jgi:serine/threonine-protein phosphatase PGAM5